MQKNIYNVEYFGAWSRDCLKVLQHMIEKWPNKSMFFTDELGLVINMEGRALGGVLAGFSKIEGESLILKLGTSTTAWNGDRFIRPKQLWGLNPKLTSAEVKQIRESLSVFRLEKR